MWCLTSRSRALGPPVPRLIPVPGPTGMRHTDELLVCFLVFLRVCFRYFAKGTIA